MQAFRVKDLMINIIRRSEAGGADTGKPNPDDDVTDFPPTVTPIIVVAIQTNRLRAFQKLGLEKVSVESLDVLARDVGSAAVRGMFLCAEDMPTCEANERISPWAATAEALRFEDLATVKELLTETLNQISQLEESRLKQARRNSADLVPMLEEALSELRGHG